jgi:TrmH family RNA methyltransferase
MKTMGMSQLALVAPRGYPCAEATARASGADDVLARAEIHTTVLDAVRNCGCVLATSSRTRNIPWPIIRPAQAAAELLRSARSGTSAAVLFGPEHAGLKNSDMEFCNAVIEIPATPAFPSLNLAAAVQIVCYELRKAVMESAGSTVGQATGAPGATADQIQLLYQLLERYISQIGYYHPGKPRLLMRRLKRMFNRLQPDQNEYNILRGILAAAEKAARKK